MKKITLVFFAILFQGCMTFKKIENNYIVKDDGVIKVLNGSQDVSGSDAEDSLNGNTPSISLPVVP